MANIHTGPLMKYYSKIKELYDLNKTFEEIVKELNCKEIIDPKQVQRIIYRQGFNKSSKSLKLSEFYRKKYEKIDKKAIELINQGYSHTQAAKELGINQQSMTNRLKKYYNIEVLADGKKKVNSNFFTNIDTEEKAYWLGFMYADGYVGLKNEIELTLQIRDANHIQKFKKALQSEHKIGTKTIKFNGKEFKAKRISIKDPQLVNDLIKWGCTNSKSLTIEMPDLPSKEAYRHFVRGYLDGDGCIMVKDRYCSCSFTSGSYKFLKSLHDYLLEVVQINSVISHRENTNTYELDTLSRYETLQLLKFLYEDSMIYLDRKYEQYQRYCRSENILLDSQNNESGIKRGWRKVS